MVEAERQPGPAAKGASLQPTFDGFQTESGEDFEDYEG